MEQAGDNTLNQEGLCILSLDGGGVRGLSTLFIIKALMEKVNAERKKDGEPMVKPCQLFDLIGGTSTGGIIAIMLGRLEMEVDDCIEAYTRMFHKVFGRKGMPLNIFGKLQGRFDSSVFEQCIGEILKDQGLLGAEPLNNGKEGCKVAVSATTVELTSTVLLRSYSSSEALNNLPFTITQAIRATSAASSFFDPVTIEPYGRQFVDGGLGANNPIEQLWNEAQNVWCQDEEWELSKILKCFISIGTGDPGRRPISEGPWKFFSKTLVEVATETEKTAKVFIDRHQRLYENKHYFRFNVQQGLQGIGLDEYHATNIIAAATAEYMDGQAMKSATRECALNLKQKQFQLDFAPERIIEWNTTRMFLSSGKTPITFVPFYRNDSLVHRDSAFKAVEKLSAQASCNQPLAIWGLGGCGKTQIALEHAYRQQKRTFCSIFWVHADSEARFREDYRDIGKIAGLPPDLTSDDLLRAVKQWMEHEMHWLLILDNADDLRIFKTTSSKLEKRQERGPELLQYVPKSQTGSVVWTSRDKAILGNIVDVNRGVEISAMTIDESYSLFRTLSGRNDSELSLHKDMLLKLLELLKRLPLAIAQAAAYIRKTNVSVPQYVEFFDESESRQSSLLSQEFQDVRSEVSNSVMLTWVISMRQIAEECPCGENILNTIAFFDIQGLPFNLLKLAGGPDVTDDEVRVAAGRLTEYSFLQAQKAGDGDLQGYEQHRLVNLAVRRGLSAAQTQVFSKKASRIMCDHFPDVDHESWGTCELYLPHALKTLAWEEAEEIYGRGTMLRHRIANFYLHQGRSNEAERIQLRLLQIYQKTDGDEHPATIGLLSQVASNWHQQGRFEEAELAELKVLELKEKVWGKGAPETMAPMRNLALTWSRQGRTIEAEDLLSQVLEQERKTLGERHPDTTVTMTNLASVWHQQGRLDEAEVLENKVLQLTKETLGKMHPHTITAMGNLACTWAKQDRRGEAEELYVNALECQKELFGERHPKTTTVRANLAATLHEQGRFEEAEKVWAEVLLLRRDVLGEKHPDTIITKLNMASTLWEQNRRGEAEKLRIEVLALQKEVLGVKHPNTAIAMAAFAEMWYEQGRFEDAEKQWLEVLKLQIEVLGEKHPDTISTKSNVASTLWKQNRKTEAENLQIEVLALQKEVLGNKHTLTVRAMANLAVTLWEQHRRDEAKQLQADVARLWKELLGDEHPSTTRAIEDLAFMTEELGALKPVQPKSSSKEPRSRRTAWRRKLMRSKEVENI